MQSKNMKPSENSKWGTIFQKESTTRIEMRVEHKPGTLSSALDVFEINKVNIKKIDSQPDTNENFFRIICDVEGTSEEENISKSINAVKEILGEKNVLVMGSEKKDIPWFPRRPSDLDLLARKTMEYGSDLDANHPGFKDEKYRERRRYIAEVAQKYKHGEPLPKIEYTEDENKTWNIVYTNLKKLYPTHACKEHNRVMPLLEKFAGYGPDKIPQLCDVSDFLEKCTGWVLRPVAGLLSTRDFINALAFRIFHSTQYIRHSSVPMYTPEPDVIHELVGHVPLLADPAFANFSQAIGLASLGASDEDIERLGTLYWFTIEFGLCKEKEGLRAYGAGILSSYGELEHSLTDKPEKVPFDPFVASTTKYIITEYQMKYFVTESFQDALAKVENFAHHLQRPFSIHYDPYTKTVEVLDNKEKTLNFALQLKLDFDNLVEALKKL